MDWTLRGICIQSSRSVYAPHVVQSVRLLLFKYRGGDNVHWISKNKMAATAVQWELCGTNFRENIANLWVSCYNGNNDRSARVLFIQHPREQGEWLLHHSPCSLGCCTNNTLATRSLSPKYFPNIAAIQNLALLQQILLSKIIGVMLLMCQNTTMRVYGAWIKTNFVLCSKTYSMARC